MSDDDTNALRSIDYEALRNLSTGAIDGCIDVLTLTEARLRMIKFPVILIMESLRAVMGVASLVKPQDNQFLLFEPFGTNVWIGLVPLVALLALLGKARPSKRLLLFFLSCSSFFCHLYCCNLRAIITVQRKYRLPFNSFQELLTGVQTGQYRLALSSLTDFRSWTRCRLGPFAQVLRLSSELHHSTRLDEICLSMSIISAIELKLLLPPLPLDTITII